MLGPRDPALQQRLDSLMAPHIAPVEAEPVAAVLTVEAPPAADWSDEPIWEEASYAAEVQQVALDEVLDELPIDEPRVSRWARFKRWLSFFAL